MWGGEGRPGGGEGGHKVLMGATASGRRGFKEEGRGSTHRQGCITGAGNSEAAPVAVRQAVGGGCRSGWGRLLSVTNAIEVGTCRQGDSGWARGCH